MNKDKALRLALEALEINLVFLKKVKPYKGQEDLASDCVAMTEETITAIKETLETKEEPVSMRMPKVGDRVICIEDESLGVVHYLTGGGSPEIKFDDGSHGTFLLRDFAELFGYADTTPQRKPLTDKQKSDLSFIAKISQDMSPVEIYLQGIADAESAHGIKE